MTDSDREGLLEITLPVHRTPGVPYRGAARALSRDYNPTNPRGRSCGACTMCCTAPPIVAPPLIPHKPPGESCAHLCATGCSVYEDRPEDCRAFACNWLRGHGTVHQRPDRMGAMPVIAEDRRQCVLYLAPGITPDTMSREARSYVKDWHRRIGSAVLLIYGEGYCTATGLWPDGFTATQATKYSYPGGHDGGGQGQDGEGSGTSEDTR